MLLKSLEMENFRQYKGVQKVEFSTDPERNVTLFLGTNTSGKTTLVQAFRWALYNDRHFAEGAEADQRSILNSDVRRGMRKDETAEAKVVLEFAHKGTTYEFVRKYCYKSHISGDAKCISEPAPLLYCHDDNGERRIVPGGESKMSEILPESLAEYFFFGGEKISKSRDPKNVKNSINTIMGLVPLEHMKVHLVDAKSSVYAHYRNLVKDDQGEAQRINQRINNVEEKLREAQEALKLSENRHRRAADEVANKKAEMAAIESVAKDANHLKEVDSKLDSLKNDLEKDEREVIEGSVPATMELISSIVAIDILESIRTSKYEDKGIPGMKASAVDYILERGKCICGADLSSHPECVSALKDLRFYLPPEDIGSQLMQLNKDLEKLCKAQDKQKLRQFHINDYYKCSSDISDKEYEREDLLERIGGNRDADLVKREYDNQVSARNQFHNDCVRYEAECKRLGREREDLLRQLSTVSKADASNKENIEKSDYVQALYNKAKEMYKSSSDQILEEFRSTLTEVFNSMYHGVRTIELTDEYKVNLSVEGESLDKSMGLDTVQNFAFICTLLKVARSRLKSELESEPYPLAMDAVFSNTDEKHIRNISTVLPQYAEQAVLAIMEKDWSFAAESLNPSVGKRYVIRKLSESHSVIEEVERWRNPNPKSVIGTLPGRFGTSRGSMRST